MTIVITCQCGGRLAAPPHLAGKDVRCPNCQQTLQVPFPPPEPIAPIANPFSDDEVPVTAEIVSPTVSTPPAMARSQDPFGGRATVDGSMNSYVPAPNAQPQGNSQPDYAKPQYDRGFGEPKKKSYALDYVLGTAMFVFIGFAALVGVGIYQIIDDIGEMNFDGSQPLVVQVEDYATARSQFETMLVTRGEAPQDWEELETPRGATKLIYHSDGHALQAFVSQPTVDGKPRPGVVFLHGGFAWGDGDWEMSQPYRDRGFVVMSPVLRSENGQPGHFSLYYDEVDDVLAATEAFAALPYVDETQLYIAGHSAGGTLATLTALTSDKFLAMASYSGAMNQDGSGDWGVVVYDATDEQEALMRSPEAFATSFKCPAELYYGSDEHWLQGECERTAATARNAGHQVQAHQVPGNHFTSVYPAILRSIHFFEQHGRATAMHLRITQAAAPVSVRPSQIPQPEIPALPEISIPDLPRPSTPRVKRFNVRTVNEGTSSTIIVNDSPSTQSPFHLRALLHQGMVTIEVSGYSGRLTHKTDARRALIRSRWADFARIEFDQESGVIRVPVRKRFDVNTEAAKKDLEEVGFEIGAITFKPIGAEEASNVAEEPEDIEAID